MSRPSNQYQQETMYLTLFQKFCEDNPKLPVGKKRRLAFLKSQKIKKNTHIYNFFSQDLKVDEW